MFKVVLFSALLNSWNFLKVEEKSKKIKKIKKNFLYLKNIFQFLPQNMGPFSSRGLGDCLNSLGLGPSFRVV